jgi:DNA-binding NarL/FixJ family response regulator
MEIVGELMSNPPALPVVICSVESDPETVEAVRQAGALGYVFKKRIETDLILAVKSAARGKPFVSPASH